MKTLRLILPLLVLAATARADELKIPFEKYVLPNGLEVILSPDHRVPTVHVQVWYHVGSKDEQAGKTGFAHLFEHMMFQGSRDIAEDTWFKKLDAVGGFGINGTTNMERTNYFESLPSNQLELGLWMESDRMGFLLDSLDEKGFRNQQDVVRNERRQRNEMSPYGMSYKTMLESMYPASHPYHHTPIGEHEDLVRASVDDVKQFFRTYYVPANATLAVVGDFDPAQGKALIEKYFGTLPKAPAPKRVKAVAPAAPVVREVAMEANVQLPRFGYTWHGPVPWGPDEAELDLATMMLTAGKASRLYKKLVYETQVAQAVSTEVISREYGGHIEIEATMKPGHTIAEGEALVDAELAKLATEPFTAAELERAKTRIEAQFVRELETAGGRAGRLQNANHYTHDPAEASRELSRYRAVTLDAVNAAAKRWLASPKMVLTVVPNPDAPLGGRVIVKGAKPVAAAPAPAPTKTTTPAATPVATPTATVKPVALVTTVAQAPAAADPNDWRKTQPKGGPAPEVKLPAPKQGKLKNGLPVIVVENHALPLVDAFLMVYAGAERTDAKQAGLADLTAELLTEGTAKHDALSLANALDDLGARLSAAANQDVASLALSTLSTRLDPSLDLFAEVVTSPAFADKELERIRAQRLTSILQQKDQPPVIASNVAGRIVFGETHPYSFPLLGVESTVKAFTRNDVAGFFDSYYRPNNAVLIVVGDTTLAAITQKLDARLSAWKSKPVKPGKPPAAPPLATARKVVIVDQPQASQSVIGLTQVGVARSSPDYVPLLVANDILGGAFSSRINMNLREKNGYSYGARSTFRFLRGPGLFFAGGNVKGDVTDKALTELLHEVTEIRRAPVTEQELHDTQSSLIGKLPARFETNGAVAQILGELKRNNLPLDWYATFAKKVGAVTAADVLRVAQKYLQPDHAQIVVVGDRAKIEAKLKALDLGPIEQRTRTGELSPVSTN